MVPKYNLIKDPIKSLCKFSNELSDCMNIVGLYMIFLRLQQFHWLLY